MLIKEQNVKLEKELLHLQTYERIGSIRDQMKIKSLERRQENYDAKIKYELEHPPFNTPTIIPPQLPELESPRGKFSTNVFGTFLTNALSKINIPRLRRFIFEGFCFMELLDTCVTM